MSIPSRVSSKGKDYAQGSSQKKKEKDVGSGSPTNGDVELETESASGEMVRFDLLVRSPGREETRFRRLR